MTGGTAGWHALLALSLAKVRFVGKESIKLDKAEEGMVVAVWKEWWLQCGKKLQKIQQYFMRLSRVHNKTGFLTVSKWINNV
jgi:hypothetical protein